MQAYIGQGFKGGTKIYHRGTLKRQCNCVYVYHDIFYVSLCIQHVLGGFKKILYNISSKVHVLLVLHFEIAN